MADLIRAKKLHGPTVNLRTCEKWQVVVGACVRRVPDLEVRPLARWDRYNHAYPFVIQGAGK